MLEAEKKEASDLQKKSSLEIPIVPENDQDVQLAKRIKFNDKGYF